MEGAETAIKLALLSELGTFAGGQTLPLQVSYPNVDFTPPDKSPTAKWLRATLFPVPSLSPHVSDEGVNTHYGFLQVDIFYGLQGGEIQGTRIAYSLVSYFKRGTVIWRDGFGIRVLRTPYVGPAVKDPEDWWMIPVRIPYTCFASDPA